MESCRVESFLREAIVAARLRAPFLRGMAVASFKARTVYLGVQAKRLWWGVAGGGGAQEEEEREREWVCAVNYKHVH